MSTPLRRVSSEDEGEGTLQTELNNRQTDGQTTPDKRHHHKRSNRYETTIGGDVIITPPNERVEDLLVPAQDKAGTVRVAIVMVTLLLIIIACFVGIFTNFGFERCNCSDLRGWFSGTLVAALSLLWPAAKGKFVK